jgi:uncharacterized protein
MVIQTYGGTGFKISGQSYDGPVIVLPDRVLAWDGASFEIFETVKQECDVLLMGTGKTMTHLPKDTRLALKSKGIHIETMDTGAAARTYNALMADGRRIAVALIPTAFQAAR